MPEYSVATKRGSFIVTVVSDGSNFRVTFDGHTYPTKFQPWLGSTHYRLVRNGSVVPVVIRSENEERVVGIADEQYRMRVTRHVPVARKNETSTHTTSRDVKAPMPGLVVSVAVKVGDTVDAGRALAIVEAMKMQSEIRAPVGGRVSSVRARAGQEVMGGAVLLTIEPIA